MTCIGIAAAPLEAAQAAVRAQVRAGAMPGAALAIGREDRVVVEEGIGRVGWTASAAKVDPEKTVYDIASLTKVVATTTAVMLLVEDGRMELDAPVSRYVPAFSGGAKDRVTVRHLLTHTAGLPAGAGASGAPAEALRQLVRTPLARAPGEAVEYSDVGFVVLWEAARAAAGEPLFRLLDRRVYGPLKMRQTTFLAGADCPRCAPTWRDDDGAPVRGVVHDPTARKLGGIAGNAGLFSTARDLGRFAAMLANGGELDGVRVLKAETVALFAAPQPGAGKRALGWDTPGPSGTGGAGTKISKAAFGHTGFTGTSLWVDPERKTWTVLLSNRVYQPQTPNRIQTLRRRVNDQVALAADQVDEQAPALAD
ncbi:MAG TPA: serine hydrolase domain-containing protein [Longimicrobium sp.]|nr:serine hydrolase domain-containing protein [Longimicrobium sp.]